MSESNGLPVILNSNLWCLITGTEHKAWLKGLQIRLSMDDKSRSANNIMIKY